MFQSVCFSPEFHLSSTEQHLFLFCKYVEHKSLMLKTQDTNKDRNIIHLVADR